MSDGTTLGDRMKRYEHVYRTFLPRRTYVLMRIDGWAFHSYLRGATKPFDFQFMEHMNEVAVMIAEKVQGVVLGYVQSDEISFLLQDFETIQSEPWFGGNTNKLLTLPAAIASAYMAKLRYFHDGLPCFDNRVWTMSDPVEVANYFLWRQQDCVRNSIQMVGQAHFSPSELFEKSCDEIQEMLWSQRKVNWNDFPATCKRGRVVVNLPDEGWVTLPAPHFRAEPDSFLAEMIPSLPSLLRKEKGEGPDN